MKNTMKNSMKKLTLDQLVTYQIKVPGHLETDWCDWAGEMTVSVSEENGGIPITTITGTIDQAALHGLLRRLYSMCLPLISVNCIDLN